jgi:hypothetical protein
VRSYDLSSTTYSPDGKVFQIEYAAKAVDNSGCVRGAASGGAARAAKRRGCNPARANPTDVSSARAVRPSLRPLRSTAVGIKCKDGVVLVRPGLACAAVRAALHARARLLTSAPVSLVPRVTSVIRALRSWS